MSAATRLRVVGPYRGPTGYDRHTRELVRAFVRAGVAVQLTHLDGWSPPLRPSGFEDELDGLDADVGATTAVHFAMPPHAVPVPGLRNVNYTMFEADRIPAAWADLAAAHDRVVVPTQACREAWRRSGIAVDVAPLGVDASFFSEACEPLDLDARAERRVRLLNVAELRPRKNHVGLLRAWTRATAPDDDAALILKVSDYQGGALQHLAQDLADAGVDLADAAPVTIVADALTDDGMRALYRRATHYVSMSHGEGWDQAAMEAAVSGLRLIVPCHTAYAELYRREEVSFVPAPAEPAVVTGRTGAEDAVLFAGANWWTPDEEAAVAAIRDAVARRDAPQAPLAARLAREHSWDDAASRLLELVAG